MGVFSASVLGVLSLILVIFPASIAVFNFSLFTGSVVGFFIVYKAVRYPWSFATLASLGLLLNYVVSTFIYGVMGYIKERDFKYTWNSFDLLYTQIDVSQALALVFVATVLVFYAVRFLERLLSSYLSGEGIWDDLRRIGEGERLSFFFVLLMGLCIVFSLVHGDITYMGTAFADESSRRVSVIGKLAMVFIYSVFIISACLILFPPSERVARLRLWFLFLGLLPSTVAITCIGRRAILYTAFLFSLCFSQRFLTYLKLGRWKVGRVVFVSVLLGAMVLWGFKVFYTLRSAVDIFYHEEKPSLREILPYAVDLLRDSYNQAVIQENLKENISKRPFILSYLAGLVSAHRVHNAPTFSELRYALMSAVPSVLNPVKTYVMPESPEEFVHPLIGLPTIDCPNTVMTAGLNDMGFIGAFFYPVALTSFYLIIFVAVKRWMGSPLLSSLVWVRLAFNLVQIEDSLGQLLTSGIRDLMIVVVVVYAFLFTSKKLALPDYYR